MSSYTCQGCECGLTVVLCFHHATDPKGAAACAAGHGMYLSKKNHWLYCPVSTEREDLNTQKGTAEESWRRHWDRVASGDHRCNHTNLSLPFYKEISSLNFGLAIAEFMLRHGASTKKYGGAYDGVLQHDTSARPIDGYLGRFRSENSDGKGKSKDDDTGDGRPHEVKAMVAWEGKKSKGMGGDTGDSELVEGKGKDRRWAAYEEGTGKSKTESKGGDGMGDSGIELKQRVIELEERVIELANEVSTLSRLQFSMEHLVAEMRAEHNALKQRCDSSWWGASGWWQSQAQASQPEENGVWAEGPLADERPDWNDGSGKEPLPY